MKTSLLTCLLLAAFLGSSSAAPLGSDITYQGRLTDAGAPAGGEYDLRFALYDADVGGSPSGLALTNENVWVTNGVFTTALDFGTNSFNGRALWLEIAVRPGASTDAFANITPRQPVTATPYALHALSFSGALGGAQLAGTYGSAVNISNAANVFAGSFSGNGGGLTNLNAASLVGPVPNAALSNAWRIGGNNGTQPANHFLGTTDNQPFEIRVNNSRVVRLQPDASIQNAPNIIAGSPVNIIAPGIVGATIAGGGSADYEANGPAPNTVGTSYGTVGGGVGNDTAGVGSVVGGGYNNTSFGFFATVAGGGVNLARADYAFVGGGLFNQATNTASTIAGGRNNRALGTYSSIGGGSNVQALGDYSSVAGGRSNVSGGNYAAIGGGNGNTSSGIYSTTAGGRFNRSTSFVTTVGGGDNNEASYTFATVGGGHDNTANNTSATVGGGGNNTSSDVSATVGGGSANTASAAFATVGGGDFNGSSGLSATVGGGNGNESSGDYSTAAGGSRNVSSGSAATVGGGLFNQANNTASTVAGGRNNRATGTYSTVGGGTNVQASGDFSTVAGGNGNVSIGTGTTTSGGRNNRAQGRYSSVAGGTNGLAVGEFSTIGGGMDNDTLADWATVGGGRNNGALATGSTVSGGRLNFAFGSYGTIGGGTNVQALGDFSTIGGGAENIIRTNAPYATIPGGRQAAAANYGQLAYASGHFANPGDAQTSVYVVRITTSTNNVSSHTELFLDGASQRMRVPRDSAWAFDIVVVGRNAGTSSARYHFRGLIENSGGVTEITGPVIVEFHRENNQWNVQVVADDDNDALVVRAVSNGFLNPMDPPVRWVATVRTTEVVFP